MPYRQRTSEHWWISYTDADGRRVRRSSGTSDHAAARALEQSLRADGYQQRRGPGTPIDEIIAEYLAPRIDSRTRATARHLLDLAGIHAEDLDQGRIDRYIDQRRESGASAGTINKELGMLSAAINAWNRAHRATIYNAAAHAKLREPRGVVRWITYEEAQRLIAAASPQVADFIRLGLYTGLRAEALMSLEWRDVDFERQLIVVRPSESPKAKPRAKSIPMHPTARDALLSCRDRCHDSPFVFCAEDHRRRVLSFKKGFSAACRRAGVQRFRIHDMRHTFASWLVMSGRPLAEVRDLLGHQSIKQTERYAHLAPENLRSAIEGLQ